MKLRNKKTGEVVERNSIVTLKYKKTSCSLSLEEAEEFSSIEQLNEKWEDYKPKEPLIKDEGIRKAVRAWAEANSIDKIIIFGCFNDSPYTSAGEVKFAEFGGHNEIRFSTDEKFNTDKIYTVTELCGSEG